MRTIVQTKCFIRIKLMCQVLYIITWWFVGSSAILDTVHIMPGDKIMAAGSRNGRVYLWDIASSRQIDFPARSDHRVSPCTYMVMQNNNIAYPNCYFYSKCDWLSKTQHSISNYNHLMIYRKGTETSKLQK